MNDFLIVSASLRQGSCSSRIMNQAANYLNRLGVTCSQVELKNFLLPFCDGSAAYPDFPDVARWQKITACAQGILFIFPEYHGSLPGALKNGLDLLEEGHLRGKMVAAVSVLGGSASFNALNTLRTVCRHMHAWVLPDQIAISHAEEAMDRSGVLFDKDLQVRLEQLCSSWVAATRQLSSRPSAELAYH